VIRLQDFRLCITDRLSYLRFFNFFLISGLLWVRFVEFNSIELRGINLVSLDCFLFNSLFGLFKLGFDEAYTNVIDSWLRM